MTKRFLLVLFTIAVAIGIYAVAIEPFWIEVTRHKVAAKLEAPIKIVQLSDLHIRSFGRREREILALLEAEKPDLIAVTGDYTAGSPNLDAMIEFFSQLQAPRGVFVISGNWEYFRKTPMPERLTQLAHIRVLNNASVSGGPGLTVYGLDDWLAGKPNVAAVLASDEDPNFRLMLFHSPAQFDEKMPKSDLALAGHTHGGQFRLPWFGAVYTPPGSGSYVHGWYEKDGSRMYVSRGIGTSIIPARIFCRPEVAIFEVGG